MRKKNEIFNSRPAQSIDIFQKEILDFTFLWTLSVLVWHLIDMKLILTKPNLRTYNEECVREKREVGEVKGKTHCSRRAGSERVSEK